MYELGQLKAETKSLVEVVERNTASNEKLFEQIIATQKDHENRLNKLDVEKGFIRGILWIGGGLVALVGVVKEFFHWPN